MNPADFAAMLEVMAAALRAAPSLQGHQAATPSHAPQAPGRTFGQWLDVHEREIQQRGYKAQTLKNRRSIIEHCRRLWGARPIAEIRPHEIAAGLRSFPAARSSTAARVHAELRDAFAEAIAADWCSYNPAAPLKRPKHKVKRARLKFDTWQAMRTLATTGPQRWVESMLLLALVTGQRRADLAKMRFDDVVDDCLRVEQQKEAGKGFGARVAIPLNLRLDAIGLSVGDVIEHCRQSAKPGPYLLRKAGGGQIEQSSLSARFHEHIVAVLGESAHAEHEWPSLHECRSLSARLYAAQGVDVQTLLGHKAPEMTAIYTNDRGLSAHEWKRVQFESEPA
jgi:integrase